MKFVYLVDYSNFNYKFRHAYKLSTRISGVEVCTSVPFGWIRTIKAIPFKDIIICLDGFPSQMLSYLPSYKGQRLNEPNEEIGFPHRHLISLLSQIGSVYNKNVHVAFNPGQEADQVISSVALRVAKQVSPLQARLCSHSRLSMETDRTLSRYAKLPFTDINQVLNLESFDAAIMGTTDSDMYQLLRFDNIFIDSSTSGKEIQSGTHTPKAVEHIHPAMIPAYKAFIGDHSDNVPGLNLGLTKACTLDLIKQYFDTPEKLLKFSSQLNSGLCEDPNLQWLVDLLEKTNQVGQFKVNVQITYLQYYSDPFVFTPHGNLQRILGKYNLKLK